ncbi:MAG: hypothetical protein EXR77_11400 [Myxococcales bacterium]|nr:hypothetical protein [Myxococcales bacterium]
MGDAISTSGNPGAAVQAWRARVGVVYLQSIANQLYEGKEEIENYLQMDIKMQLATLAIGVDSPWGMGLTAILPWVKIWKDEALIEPATYTGQGDLELRLRQDMTQLLQLKSGPRWGVSLGVVAPTGVYLATQTEKNFLAGQATVNATTRELNIGRGVWWLLADADVAYPFLSRFLVHAGAQWRAPQTIAGDGFAWGNEIRANLGLRVIVVDRYLSVGVVGDAQRRGRSTYTPEGKDTARLEFANGGGVNAYLSPGLYSNPFDWLGFSASYRLPIHNDVNGQQVVQGPSVFFGVNGSFTFASKPVEAAPKVAKTLAVIGESAKVAEVAALVVAGKITIVDYWATWCDPCVKLGPELDAFAKGRPAGDVVIVRVNASDWQAEQWAHYLPDAAGLPVLDIFDATGILRARLQGDEVDRFAEAVTAIAPAEVGK